MYYLSKQSTYESYHAELKKYFNKKYDKKPSQTDNLAFIILLTYPEKNINNLTSVKDLKLAFNNKEEDSDFKPFGFEVGEYDEHTCICNEPICNVHRFQNIYSGMVINIGSVCNLSYGLAIKQSDIKPKLISSTGKKVFKREKETNALLATWDTIVKASEAENMSAAKMSRYVKNKNIVNDYYYSVI